MTTLDHDVAARACQSIVTAPKSAKNHKQRTTKQQQQQQNNNSTSEQASKQQATASNNSNTPVRKPTNPIMSCCETGSGCVDTGKPETVKAAAAAAASDSKDSKQPATTTKPTVCIKAQVTNATFADTIATITAVRSSITCRCSILSLLCVYVCICVCVCVCVCDTVCV
jgi:hypothetical protein